MGIETFIDPCGFNPNTAQRFGAGFRLQRKGLFGLWIGIGNIPGDRGAVIVRGFTAIESGMPWHIL